PVYHGGSEIVDDPLNQHICQIATDAIFALPGTPHGVIGVDLMVCDASADSPLTSGKPMTSGKPISSGKIEEKIVVIEINPRLTTSFAAWLRVLPDSILAPVRRPNSEIISHLHSRKEDRPLARIHLAMDGVFGIDIGGANIKLCNAAGNHQQVSFAMWRQHHQLQQQLTEMLLQHESLDTLLVTMTGELADCFDSRSQGVMHIADAARGAATNCGCDLFFYDLRSGWLGHYEVTSNIHTIAAANWHATGQWLAQRVADPASLTLLVDIGSTTTDLIPMRGGAIVGDCKTDFERAASGQLVYIGVDRTPLCGLLNHVRVNDREDVAVFNELFATMDDAMRIVVSDLPSNDEPVARRHPVHHSRANR
ncbi:MAG: hydantoinase/oxoprolinase family protein, partial [Planctomycetota bacterium]